MYAGLCLYVDLRSKLFSPHESLGFDWPSLQGNMSHFSMELFYMNMYRPCGAILLPDRGRGREHGDYSPKISGGLELPPLSPYPLGLSWGQYEALVWNNPLCHPEFDRGMVRENIINNHVRKVSTVILPKGEIHRAAFSKTTGIYCMKMIEIW